MPNLLKTPKDFEQFVDPAIESLVTKFINSELVPSILRAIAIREKWVFVSNLPFTRVLPKSVANANIIVNELRRQVEPKGYKVKLDWTRPGGLDSDEMGFLLTIFWS